MTLNLNHFRSNPSVVLTFTKFASTHSIMAKLKLIYKISILFFACIISQSEAESLPCVPKSFGKSSVVCVCNATYCDTVEPLGDIPDGQYFHMVSSMIGQRFETKMGRIEAEADSVDAAANPSELWVESRLQYQKMIGFGGAFTDAAGINFLTLPKALQDNIMSSYFSDNGLEYNIGRIPIGGADFSDRPYTLCDTENNETDVQLTKFALQNDDLVYKIPFIKEAQKIKPNLKLFASPWSAPTWMKSNKQFVGFSKLLPEFYQPWANYLIRFLEEYEKNDLHMWALTVQNEPSHGSLIKGEWNSMGWTPQQQRDFIKNNMGPTLRNSKFNSTKLIMMDDQRFSVVLWSQIILGDPESAQYVDGIGLHWYANPYIPPFPLNVAHNLFPDYFMINTEACTGYLHFIPGVDPVIMGSWERAELYAHNIIEDLNHWLTGWVEWNLILAMDGGPNWAGNQVDAPIIVDKDAAEAYKQPMFYALGHFTKFLSENSVRVGHTGKELRTLEVLSVLRPDNKIVLVIYNKGDVAVPLKIRDSVGEGAINVNIGGRSINTIVYSSPTEISTATPIDNTTPRTNPGTTPASTDNAGSGKSQIGFGIISVLAIICMFRS